MKSLSCVRLFATPWTVTHQAPPSMGFSRQEYWSGWPFPPPGDLLNLLENPGLLHCRQTLYRLSQQGSPILPLYPPPYPVSCGTSQVIRFLSASVSSSVNQRQQRSLPSESGWEGKWVRLPVRHSEGPRARREPCGKVWASLAVVYPPPQ